MTQPTFFFYDLETSGLNPKQQRIMQFAGQRTDADLNIIGDPVNVLVTLSDDVLPEPYSVLVTGITPQKTLEEGYTEAEFLRLFFEQVCLPGTTTVGFNNVRFDDEFMRYTLFRNFYDPYEWQWANDCSRWDILDVIRMTRALRPVGIQWPVDADGNITNRLELITKENNLAHANAHDALSDVLALIDVTRLIKDKQPKLFDYLFQGRSKHAVNGLVDLANPQPFVYTSGRYPKETLHTTVAYPIAEGSRPGAVVVYDLRHDPTQWAHMSVDELRALRFAKYEQRQMEGFLPLPAKELVVNKCPTVAPVGVIDTAAQERIVLPLTVVQRNLALLQKTDLPQRLAAVFAREGGNERTGDVDGSLYAGFVGPKDKPKMLAVRSADAAALKGFTPDFSDKRLKGLLVRYKARNFPNSLTDAERASWEDYRAARLQADLPGFSATLHKLASERTSDRDQFLLQELQLWAESIMPSPHESE